MINIYEYSDYRKFMKDFIIDNKSKSGVLSFRNLAKQAGFGSSGYLKMVMDGSRNLSAKVVRKVAKAFKLKGRDVEFFETLVNMNQATDDTEKAQFYDKIMTYQRFNKVHQMEKDVYELFSRWYIPAVYELVLLSAFKADPKWIVSKLNPKITQHEAKHALEILEHLHLIEINQRTKGAKQIKGNISTPDEVVGMAIQNVHEELLNLSHHALAKVPNKNKELVGLTIALTKEQFNIVRKRVRNFRRDINARYSGNKKAEAVYQMNMQLFPLSEMENE